MSRKIVLTLIISILLMVDMLPLGVFSLEKTSGSQIPTIYLTSANWESEGRAFVDASKSNVTTGSMKLTNLDGTTVYDGGLTQIKA